MNKRFKKGDIIKSPHSHSCIVIDARSDSEIYNVWVIDPSFYISFKVSTYLWNIVSSRTLLGIPEKIGEVHSKFIDLFLSDLK